MPWFRANFAVLIVCALSMSAAAADDFKAQHEHAVSANPAGVHFAIAVRDGQKRFRIGERITLDYTFTADAPGKYLAGASNRDQSGRSTYEKFVVDRPDDAADPLAGFFDLSAALYCDSIGLPLTSRKPLGPSSPATDSVSLTQYLRFHKPGHYRVYVTTQQVIRADARPVRTQPRNPLRPSVDDPSLFSGSYDFGGPPLTSDNIVEVEILPQDMKAAREEVEAIIARSKGRPDPVLATPDAVRLFEIGTPQARQAAAQLYPSNSIYYRSSGGPYEALAAMLTAPDRSETIELIRQRLLNPAIVPDQDLLAILPVLQVIQKNPGLTADDVRNGGRLNGDRLRNLMLTNIVAEYQTLMASLDQRAAADRAATIRLLHLNLGITKACSMPIPLPAEDAEKLKRLHWATLLDLPERDLNTDVFNLRWAEGVPEEQILPVLEKAYNSLSVKSDQTRVVILRSIAGYDPELAGKLFRRRVIDYGWTPELSNFLQESWYESFGGADLDEYFGKVFSSAHTEEMERNAPLLARFGTAAVLPQIKQVYEVQDAKWPCSVQAGMLAYFLRVASAYGAPQTRIALEKSYKDKDLNCREQSLLASIAFLYQAPQLETLANEALDDARPLAAVGAAKTINIVNARQMPYQHLLERLQKLHGEWPDYASHASDTAYTSRWKSGGYDGLEQILTQLLTANPTSRAVALWPSVQDACVTDECRIRVGGRIRSASAPRVQTAH
jgi:hypothetical protein